MIEREVGLQVLDADATACTLVFVPADPGVEPGRAGTHDRKSIDNT